MRKIQLFTIISTLFLLTGVAVAQTPVEADPGGFFLQMYNLLKGSAWMPLFGSILILIVFIVRKVLSNWVEWFKTKLGGYVISFSTAVTLAVGTALMAGKGVSFELLTTAISASFMASGGWEAVRDILNSFYTKDPS